MAAGGGADTEGVRTMVLVALLAAFSAADDTVHLENGGMLRGAVVEESDDAVVLDVGGGRMRIPRGCIRLVERNATSEPPRKVRTRRDEWFLVLHREKVAGWRHVVATEGRDYVQAEEHTVFFRPNGGDDVSIRRVETAARDGVPREFLVMESYGASMEVVSGKVHRGRIHVQIVRDGATETRDVTMPAGWRLALPASSDFLESAAPGETKTITVLDPRRLRPVRLLLQRHDDAASPERGDPRPCRSITFGDAVRRTHALYRPGEGSLTVELNGRSLVARRTTPERVALAREANRGPAPLTLEEAKRFPFVRRPPELEALHARAGLKLTSPDAGWVPETHDVDRGLVLTFEKIALFASVEVFVYGIEARTTVEDCLARTLTRMRHAAAQVDLEGDAVPGTIGGLPALTVAARARHRGEDLFCLITVVRAADRYVALVGAGPDRFRRWGERDFRKLAASLVVVP
jgi:hypothetical protein